MLPVTLYRKAWLNICEFTQRKIFVIENANRRAELEKVALEEWEKISPLINKRLINSLPKEIEDVIKGGITDWSKHENNKS